MSVAAFSPFVNGSCTYSEPAAGDFGTPSDTAVIVLGAILLLFDALLVGYVYWNKTYLPLMVKQPAIQALQFFGEREKEKEKEKEKERKVLFRRPFFNGRFLPSFSL